MEKKILAIIPARGNSKGIPGKNLYPFCGKPLVAWTIEASLNSKNLSRVIISSESDEVLSLSKKYKVDYVKRDQALSQDQTLLEDVVLDLLDELHEKEKYNPNTIVLLQPTSPLRSATDIDKAISLYKNSDCDGVISGYQPEIHPFKTFLVNDNKKLITINNKYSSPRQLLPKAFHPNGAIYIIKTKVFKKTKCFLSDEILPFYMDETKSADIDTIDDLKKAEKIHDEK